MNLAGELRRDDVLWLLGNLCGIFRIPFDASLIAQGYPPPYTLATLHEAARALGIKTGDYLAARIDWQKLPLPAIAFEPLIFPIAAESSAPPANGAPPIPETGAPPTDTDIRRGGLQPRPADGGTLCQDDQQAQGEGDDAVHYASNSEGVGGG